MSSSSNVINYLDSNNNLTDIGKLSIGSTIMQSASNGQGQAIGIVTDKKITNNTCVITIDASSTFGVREFKFMQGGTYGKNSASFGKHCTVAGNNSIGGGNGINVWGSNSIGWGSAENWNLEGDKVNCQDKIAEWDAQAEEYLTAANNATDPVEKTYNIFNYTQAIFKKEGYESRLKKLNLYEDYQGVGNNSAVFGSNNSSIEDNSLVSGIFNRSQGVNSLVVGEGNVAEYPNMIILGDFSKSSYSENGMLNYDYATKSGVTTHDKIATYSKPQLLIGNGGVSGIDSNSFEVYANGLVRSAKSFRVGETGEIGIFSETLSSTNKTYKGLRLVAFNTNLFLDSGHYVCPVPSKSEKTVLGAPLSYWGGVYSKKYMSTATISGDSKEKYFSVETRKYDVKDSKGNITGTYYYPTLVGVGSTNNNVMMLDCPSTTYAMKVVPNPNRAAGSSIGHGDFDDLRWGIYSKGINNKGNIKNSGNIEFTTTYGQMGTATSKYYASATSAGTTDNPSIFITTGTADVYARVLLTSYGDESALWPLYHNSSGEQSKYISLGCAGRPWKAAYIN